MTKKDVLTILEAVLDVDGAPLSHSKHLSDIVISGQNIFISIQINENAVQLWEPIRRTAEVAVQAIARGGSVIVALTAERSPAAHSEVKIVEHKKTGVSVPGVNAIIAIASGKGGVGKSTTAVNVALGLSALGLRVGVLDADIYGPSVPKLLAVRERPELLNGKRIKPIKSYGLTLMSIGFLVEEETPIIWRGPMVMSALTQMLREVEWGLLDVMVVDMPPGTGDAQITIAQQVALAGAIIVSTPQDLALIDVRRGIAMFKQVDVPVIGIIENMSFFLCPHCDTRSDVFAHGGAKHEAARLGIPFLGEVPLDAHIRETSDSGRPVVVSDPDGSQSKLYCDIAARINKLMKEGFAPGQNLPQ